MVGWNVAVMQLVAERVLHKISNIVYFTSAIVITINEYDEHVEFLYEHMFSSVVSLMIMYACSSSKYFVSAFQHFMNAHVHGAGFPDG